MGIWELPKVEDNLTIIQDREGNMASVVKVWSASAEKANGAAMSLRIYTLAMSVSKFGRNVGYTLIWDFSQFLKIKFSG
jgi:hypothetical protein